MAMSFVAKYPNRIEIIPELIATAIEELEHFQEVHAILHKRGIALPHKIAEDIYVKRLLDQCRSGREERFMDRLLLASIIECRGAERFKLIADQLTDLELKRFYKKLWASEAKHGNIFVKMSMNYFDEKDIYVRLEELNELEDGVLKALPIKAALH